MADEIERQLQVLGGYLEAESGVDMRWPPSPVLAPVVEPEGGAAPVVSAISAMEQDQRREGVEGSPASDPRRRRRLGIVVAAAAAVLVIVLLVAVWDRSERDTVITEQPTPSVERAPTPVDNEEVDLVPTPAPVAPVDPGESTGAAPTISWTESARAFDAGSMILVSDGEWFYLISDAGVERSVDGLVWEDAGFEVAPEVELLLAAGWTDTDAAAGRIGHLVMRPEPGISPGGDLVPFVHLFDTVSGVETSWPLAFPHRPTSDLRGFVAINDQGEAVAFTYDLDGLESDATALFHSPDGKDWSEVADAPLPKDSIIRVAAIGDGFVATQTWPTSGTVYWYSEDGLAWNERQLDEPAPAGLVSWNDAAIAYHESAFGPQALSANPAIVITASGVSELAVDLEPLEVGGGYGPAVATGGIGIVSLTPVSDDENDAWFVEYSPDGLTWTREQAPFMAPGLALVDQPAANATTVLVPANGSVWVGTVAAGSPLSSGNDEAGENASPATGETAAVVFDGASCTPTFPASLIDGPLHIEITNTGDTVMALILGTYHDGHARDDFVTYANAWPGGSDRPDFLNATEIIEVPARTTRTTTVEVAPGQYFAACMAQPNTMIVLDDLIIT